MKIGIFSDVHGHLDELKRTLHLFDDHAVDEIICGGDLIEKGAYSDEVVRLMAEREIICVMGNHDMKAKFGSLTYDVMLSDASFRYLSKLPMSLTVEWCDMSVYLCHTTPWEDK